MGDFEASFRSVVRGFHVYRAVWTPILHEELTTQLEYGNPEDRYAVRTTRGLSLYLISTI